MNTQVNEYLLPEGVGLQAVSALLATHCRFIEESSRSVRRSFFDSFDWGAYLAGGMIEERVSDGMHQLRWQELGESDVLLAQAVDTAPAFADELPPGPLRDRVAAAIGTRRLLRLASLESDVHTMRLLNGDEKTVVRLVIEQNRLEQPQGHTLPPRLRLVALTGYEDAFAAMDALLRDELGLVPAHTPLLQEVLTALGRRPGDYSSKIACDLDRDERADAASKEILLCLLDTLEANIEGVKSNLDAEFLHDLRVATRRTRCALAQIKRVFPAALVDEYKERFAWLQAVTGKVRDLDVYLLGFGDYQLSLPHQLQSHLEPLRTVLRAHYEEERGAMVRALDSPRFHSLIREWRAFLELPVPLHTDEGNAQRPAKAVADDAIWRLTRRVRREGRAITPKSPPEEMHELRKSCKKLRYLMEFFRSLYPPEEIRNLVKQLKVLLDNLGGFQDLSVQGRHLMEVAERMREEGVRTETLLAMGALIGDICRRQEDARGQFAALFETFDAKENRRRFKALLSRKKRQGTGGSRPVSP
jgi:CHAD domain-containing protein